MKTMEEGLWILFVVFRIYILGYDVGRIFFRIMKRVLRKIYTIDGGTFYWLNPEENKLVEDMQIDSVNYKWKQLIPLDNYKQW